MYEHKFLIKINQDIWTHWNIFLEPPLAKVENDEFQ